MSDGNEVTNRLVIHSRIRLKPLNHKISNIVVRLFLK